MPRLGSSDLDVSPLCLGGNVFGWTADEEQSFAVLDAFLEGGGTFVDTADVYSDWADGHVGGESERVLGRWMADRGVREEIVLATKVGMLDGVKGLAPDTIRRAVEGSLERLQTDRIDLYWAHVDDETVPLAVTLGAFHELVEAGTVRALGASNITGVRLAEALRMAENEGLTPYVALQQHYNLMERERYEGELRRVVEAYGLASVPYFGLASGFLTGKYRSGTEVQSQRAGKAARYLDDPRAGAVLAMLDEVADDHGVSVAAVALAWLAAQPTVTAPIASARTTEQLAELMAFQELQLSDDQLAELSAVSAPR